MTQSQSSNPVRQHVPFTYTLTVTNQGPITATDVVLTDDLPVGATFLSASAEQGSFVEANGTVTFLLGELSVGETVRATIELASPFGGAFENRVQVAANEREPDLSNNTSVALTDVQFAAVIRGQNFQDENGNGVRDAGEVGLNGFTIELVNPATREILGTTVTRSVDLNQDGEIDAETERGIYELSTLTTGTYEVREQNQPGFVPTFPRGGTIVTERVSVDGAGQQSDGFSSNASLSSDGRFVAFESLASDLVPNDNNNRADVFVYDRQTGAIERVSVPDPSTGETEANNSSSFPTISPNGRFVAYESRASNVVIGDTNGFQDVFVHDRLTKTTERASVSVNGGQGDNRSGRSEFGRGPSLSADGRYVAFQSVARNLVPGDTNEADDVFVKDRQTGLIERINVNAAGQETTRNQFSHSPSISAEGRFVSFTSVADNLVAGDTNRSPDVFVKDRLTGAVQRVSCDVRRRSGHDVRSNGLVFDQCGWSLRGL